MIACVQAFGSVAHRHPHLHVLMTDGAFRRDGTFVPLPAPEAAVLEELWRRAVLAESVRHGWLEEDAAAGMLAWPHSGFGAYIGPRIEDREGVLRVARYSARAPIAEGRLRSHAECAEAELVADRLDGPCAGVHRMKALEFLARWVDHVPERYEVRVRYAGAYATRRRVWWRQRGVVLVAAPPVETVAPEPAGDWPALRARRRRWAGLLRLVSRWTWRYAPAAGARCGSSGSSPSLRWCGGSSRTWSGVGWRRAGPWAGAAAAPGVGRVRGRGAAGALQGCRNGRRRWPRMGGGRRDEPAVARTGEFGMERRAGTGVDSVPRAYKFLFLGGDRGGGSGDPAAVHGARRGPGDRDGARGDGGRRPSVCGTAPSGEFLGAGAEREELGGAAAQGAHHQGRQ